MEEIKIPKSIKIILLIFIVIFLFLMYLRFVSTAGLKVKEYKIVNSNISNNYHGLKIVHFSDIHYKSTINYKDLNEVVDKINYIKKTQHKSTNQDHTEETACIIHFETAKSILVNELNPKKMSITPDYSFIAEGNESSKDEVIIKSINVIL